MPSVLSLVICLLICIAWTLSFWYEAALSRSWGSRHFEAFLSRGQLGFVSFSLWDRPFPLTLRADKAFPPPAGSPLGIGWRPDVHWQLEGFVWASGRYWPPIGWQFRQWPHFRRLEIPCWPLVALTAALPAVRGYQWVRQHTPRPAGLCPNCGYDLRATPVQCPECGIRVHQTSNAHEAQH